MLKEKKKRVLYFLPALIIVLSIIYYLYPVYFQIDNLRSEIIFMKEDNSRMEDLLLKQSELKDELKKLDEEVSELSNLLPSKEKFNTVVKELEQIFISSQARITGVNFGQLQRNPEDGYGKYNVNITAEGSAGDNDKILRSFLAEIEAFPYLLIIEKIDLHSGEATQTYNDEEEENSIELTDKISRINLNCVLFMAL